ncbi:MAG: hypothetical protein HN932_13010 [Candidatus Marinimicrobia bacterium]|jgi:hypothetical protein|nr:hypothetical protein [Candidatus Neomarinimicrobiota bacterium]MBT7339073.1 hypothetical protein [Candidatus Jacksonbacteria bacterium]
MISLERAYFVKSIADEKGVEATSEELGVSIDSVERYLRIAGSAQGNWGKKMPKVLILDLETSLTTYRTFDSKRPQFLRHNEVVTDWHLHTWAAKWLFDSEMISDAQTHDEAVAHDDKRITESLYWLVDQADFVIAHNARGFDVKRMNTRFLKNKTNGGKQPSLYRVIDTLLIAKKHFAFASNAMDNISRELGLTRKLDAGRPLWDRCYEGDMDAFATMLNYNEYDVRVLEEVYVMLRGWENPHPNMALYMDITGNACTVCCEKDTLLWKGYYYTNAAKYDACQCQHCGAHGRKRTSALTKVEKKMLLSPVPR